MTVAKKYSFSAAESTLLDSTVDGTSKKEMRFASGEPFDEESKAAFRYIGEYAFSHAARVPWEANDVLVINNRMVMHARDSFSPPRQILVALVSDHD